MSLPDELLDEPSDKSDELCPIHNQYYRVGLVCGECLELEFDRAFQDKLDERRRRGL